MLSQFSESLSNTQQSSHKLPDASNASPAPAGKDFSPQLHAKLSQLECCIGASRSDSNAAAAPVEGTQSPSQEQRHASTSGTVAMPVHNRLDCTVDQGHMHKRARLAEGWLGCPIGTLPTCIAGVGLLPALTILKPELPPPPVVHQPLMQQPDTNQSRYPVASQPGHQQAPVQQQQQHVIAVQQQVVGEQQQLWHKHGAPGSLLHNSTNGTAPVAVHRLGVYPDRNVNSRVGRVGLVESPEAVALRDVQEVWDGMLGERNGQLARLLTGVVQQLSALDNSLELAGQDSMKQSGLAFDSARTVDAMLQGLQLPIACDTGEPEFRLGSYSASRMVAGRGDAGQTVDCVAGVAGKGERPSTVTPGVKSQRSGLWNAEIEAQVREMGLLQPLLQCCAGE